MAKPSIGRIVHYVDGSGKHVPAIIADVESQDKVSLAVFHPTANSITSGPDPCGNRHPVGSTLFIDSAFVKHDEEKAPKTWHWPEREE